VSQSDCCARAVGTSVLTCCVGPAVITSDGVTLSWDDVYDEFAPAITSYARSRGIRDPEDVAHDVLTTALRQLATFDGDRSGLRSLLFTIAYRRIADRHRRVRRRPETLVADHTPQADPGPTIEESIGQTETTTQAVAALSVLSDRERDVLAMRIIDEASPAEVGATLGLSRGNVRVIQTRALAKVRRYLRSIGVDSQSMFNVGVPFVVVQTLRADLPTDGALGGWIASLRAGDMTRSADNSATSPPAVGAADAAAGSWTVKAESALSSLPA
jgi:RNA polymerase sigma-70 factor, ECF subfamily